MTAPPSPPPASSPASASPGWAGPYDVIVVGGRLAGAVTAHALAPYAGRILLLERGKPGSYWPQQVTWDRPGNLIWADLGLTSTVLGCGAPKLRSHTRTTLGVAVECRYPDDDEHCYRMSVSRELLDPALAARAAQWDNVTLLQPAKAIGALTEGGRVTGVRVAHAGREADVTASLVVFADGRLSRHVTQIGAAPYAEVPSPWTALIAYFRDVPLPEDHTWYNRGDGSMFIVTPTGPGLWCAATAFHRDLISARRLHPVRLYHDTVLADPVLGPALARGTQVTSVGGAGKLRMHARPMAVPGWCLVGDSGYHLDPMSAQGAFAALTTARLLRDRVAALGRVSAEPEDYAGLTAERDALLEREWQLTRRVIAAYRPGPEAVDRAVRLAADPAAQDAEIRTMMGLPPRPRESRSSGLLTGGRR